MEHFVRVVLEKNDELAESLDESVFPNNEKYETEQGATAVSYTHLTLPTIYSV